jgi:hypothetical protein
MEEQMGGLLYKEASRWNGYYHAHYLRAYYKLWCDP